MLSSCRLRLEVHSAGSKVADAVIEARGTMLKKGWTSLHPLLEASFKACLLHMTPLHVFRLACPSQSPSHSQDGELGWSWLFAHEVRTCVDLAAARVTVGKGQGIS
jgi:hypothetical protein